MLSQEVAFIHTTPTAAVTCPLYTGLLGTAKKAGQQIGRVESLRAKAALFFSTLSFFP